MDNLETIKKTASLVNNITLKELETKTRLRYIVDARRMVFAVARTLLGMSYMEIAKRFDMNHASIIHHVKQHKNFIKYDVFYTEKYNTILELFKNEIGFVNTNELIEEIKRLKQELKNNNNE